MRLGGNFGWLKRLMPRGIYGRAALILFLPVVTLLTVVSVMFLQRHFEGVTRQMTGSMAHELAFVASRIEAAPAPGAAMAAGREVAGPLGIALAMPASDVATDLREPWDLSGRVVIEELHRALPQVRAVDLAADPRRVSVQLDGPAGPWQATFDRRRVSASNPHQLLVLMVFTTLLMTGIAAIFLRNQMRPIRRLADAADAFGKGRVVPFKPSGATELRSAGAAFLDMRNRIERQIEQRTLMLSGISHDLRTPLTRLRLGLSMLPDDSPPDPEDIAAMERDVAEMGRLIDAFLAFSRADAQDGPPETLAVLEFVQGVVANAQRGGLNVALIGTEGPPDGTATFRPDAMRRALENLIGNAVRYGNRAEISVALSPRTLRITVEDDGPGIPENQRDEALRPFTRLDPARNQNRGSGVGLGLSIAADTARAHGGQLRLGTSRLGGLKAEILIAR